MTAKQAREIIDSKREERFAKINPLILNEIFKKVQEVALREEYTLEHSVKSKDEADFVIDRLRKLEYYVHWVNQDKDPCLLRIIW